MTRAELEADLRVGLWSDPPWLPPRWFYDERGSRLFDEITRLPEYYPTRAEREILARRSPEIVELTGARSVHELGAGTSDKTRVLLDALTRDGRPALYAPLDISSEVLLETAERLREEYPSLVVEPDVADFHRLPPLGGEPGERLLVFLGGTIGNFEEEERQGFLRMVREALDPGDYLDRQLAGWDRPAIVYRAVGKYREDELATWLQAAPDNVLTVFVGSSSSDAEVRTTLPRALELHREVRPSLPLGGVTIPERHSSRGDEHERLLRKQHGGAGFFISQIVYDIGAAKNLASDYRYAVVEDELDPAPLIFTLSLCGSDKTLSFLEWLGVRVPSWVRNEIVHADDPLKWSRQHALNAARELTDFCRYLGIPFGFNIESVSSRRVEIEAAEELTHEVAALLERD